MFWRGIYFPLGILILTKSEVQHIFDILYGILDSAKIVVKAFCSNLHVFLEDIKYLINIGK